MSGALQGLRNAYLETDLELADRDGNLHVLTRHGVPLDFTLLGNDNLAAIGALIATSFGLGLLEKTSGNILGYIGAASAAQGAKADNAGAVNGLLKSNGSAGFSAVTDNSANWNTAYADRNKWDGGATGLNATTGRTSLGLGTLATQSGTFSGTSSGTNTGDQVVPVTTGSTASQWFNSYDASAGAFTKSQPTFTDLAAHPTTISGYGITDLNSLGDVRWSALGHTHAQSEVTNLVTDLAAKAPLASPTFTGTPLAPTAAAGNNTTQIATTAFVATAITSAVSGMLNFKGTTDCSANPNYPSAVKGDAYIVSVAGKIGGGSGTTVDVGDWFVADADNAGGTEASVGTSWGHMEHNLVGALLSSNNLSDVSNTLTARSNLGVAIGSDVQAFSSVLSTYASVAPSANAQTILGHSFSQMRSDLALVVGTNVQAWGTALDIWSGITPAAGVGTFLATPTLANLKSAITDETAVGWNLLTLANPSAITFLQLNADNSVTAQSAGAQRTALSLVLGTDVVAFGGALGTPASGTLTNCTGLPIGGINFLDTDGTLAANSDAKVASQKAVKTYVTAHTITNSAGAGVVPVSNGTNLIASSIVDDGTVVSGGYGPAKFSFIGLVSAIGDIDSAISGTKIVIDADNNEINISAGGLAWNGNSLYSSGANLGTPSAGVLTNCSGLLSSGVVGTVTNDNAAAGAIGEYVAASVVQGSATALTTATPKTVTGINLTAGDWDVTAIGAITGASTGTEFDVAIGTTTNSMTGTVLGNSRCQTPTVSLAGSDASLMIPSFRVSLASTTTIYLIVQETFTLGSPAAYGRISARRVR